MLPDMLECWQFVNSDEFAKGLSPFDPSAASITASRYMIMKINYLLGRYETFAIETTLATRSLMKVVQEAQSMGYEVSVLYFWLNSPELAISRVRDRVAAGGHNIPDNVIRRRYLVGLKYFFEIYKPLCDHWILADNSRSPFSVVAEGSKHLSHIKDIDKFRVIWKLIYPNEDY